jgi:F0F1-type ATP synthase assembly protein I
MFSQGGVYWSAVLRHRNATGGNVAEKRRRFSLARTAQSLQENVSSAGPAAAASYTLIGAIMLLGGIGYGIDRWRGTSPWFLLAGLLLGVVVGFYELIKTVYQK